MNPFVFEHKPQFDGIIEYFKKDIVTIRTGRANPAMVEDISIEAYGMRSPLKQLASISAPDPKTIAIEPWDKSVIKDIERSIAAANLGFSPVNEGNMIRIGMVPLTEERRNELIKKLGEKVEDAKIKVRQARDKARETILEAEKGKDITEDDKFRYLKELDMFCGEYNEKIRELAEKKSTELREI
ncbi:MAG: ribosome recycling factor [Parcubacteria group bacterium]|nr:ribosome recycling factor [Parcubacteria group bacterium]